MNWLLRSIIRTSVLSIILIASSFLIMSQNAQALGACASTCTINVLNNQTNSASYAGESGASAYQFQLSNTFFNLTDTTGANNSTIWKADIQTQLFATTYSGLDHNVNYVFDETFNQTWEIKVQLTYWVTNSFLGAAAGYHHEFHLLNNSAEVANCVSDSNGFTNTFQFLGGIPITPNPRVSVSMDLGGRYATNPSITVGWSDAIWGDTTCNLNGQLCLLGFIACAGSGIQFSATSLYAPPAWQITMSDPPEQYQELVQYQFDTQAGVIAQRDAFNAANAQACAQTFIFFGVCDITNTVKDIVSFFFDTIGSWVLTFLGPIPFIGPVFQFMGSALASFGTAILTFLNLLFPSSNARYHIQDILWMHIVYLECLATIPAGIMRRYDLLLTLPGYAIYYFTLAFIWAVYFFLVWIPIRLADVIGRLIGKISLIPI